MRTIEPYTPIQYVMGRTEFFGLDITVNENVLIPRPETEVLVEAVIEVTRSQGHKSQVTSILDLCTGSGNIAIALTKNMPDCRIVASDISDKALRIARINAARNGCFDKIEFINSNLFNNISAKFDIIVSNPPYIARHEFAGLQKEVLKEPHIALYGGADGLDFYREIIKDAPEHLNESGYLAFEIGFGQLNGIKHILNGSKRIKFLEAKKDRNGIDRVVISRWIN